MNEMNYEGQVALITGATRGIGRAVALAYANEGAHLILVGRTTGGLEEVDDEIRAAGGSAHASAEASRRHHEDSRSSCGRRDAPIPRVGDVRGGVVEPGGLEPPTSALQRRRSPG